MSRLFGKTPNTFDCPNSDATSRNLGFGFDIGKGKGKSPFSSINLSPPPQTPHVDSYIPLQRSYELNVPSGTTQRDLDMGNIKPGHGPSWIKPSDPFQYLPSSTSKSEPTAPVMSTYASTASLFSFDPSLKPMEIKLTSPEPIKRIEWDEITRYDSSKPYKVWSPYD